MANLNEDYENLKQSVKAAVLLYNQAEEVHQEKQESFRYASRHHQELLDGGVAGVAEIQAADQKRKEVEEVFWQSYYASRDAREVYVQAAHVLWQFEQAHPGLL